MMVLPRPPPALNPPYESYGSLPCSISPTVLTIRPSLFKTNVSCDCLLMLTLSLVYQLSVLPLLYCHGHVFYCRSLTT